MFYNMVDSILYTGIEKMVIAYLRKGLTLEMLINFMSNNTMFMYYNILNDSKSYSADDRKVYDFLKSLKFTPKRETILDMIKILRDEDIEICKNNRSTNIIFKSKYNKVETKNSYYL